jgi:hypothetical protein
MRRSKAIRLTLLPLLASAALAPTSLASAEETRTVYADPNYADPVLYVPDDPVDLSCDQCLTDPGYSYVVVPVIRGGFGGVRVYAGG